MAGKKETAAPRREASHLASAPTASAAGAAAPKKKKKQPTLPFGTAPVVVPELYVAGVRGNVKGSLLLAAGIQLGPRVFILGDNTTGKSAITMAIELALTGAVSDLMGRDEVRASRELIAYLCPPDAKELFAEVTLSDGRTASWRCERGRKESHKPLDGEDPSRVLPVRTVFGAIKASGDGARTFLFRHACKEVRLTDVWRSIAGDLAADALTVGLPDPDVEGLSGFEVSESLLKALAKGREEQSKAQSELKGAEDLLSQQAAGLPTEPTDRDMEDLESVMEASRTATVAARIHASEGDARKKLADAIYERAQLAAKYAAGREDYAELVDLRAANHVLTAVVRDGLQHCPTCGESTKPAVFSSRLTMLKEHVPEMDEVNALQQETVTAYNRISVLDATIAELEKRLLEAPDEVLPVADAEEQEKAASDAIVTAKATREQWLRVRSARETIDAKRAKVERFKRLVTSLQTAVNELLDAALLKFRGLVSGMLPDGWAFQAEGDGDKFRIAVEHNGTGGNGLSDAELSIVTAAIGGAVAGSFAVIIPKDRAYDSKMLGRALAGLSCSPVQTIVASPIPPDVLPDGWLVLNTAMTVPPAA